MKSPKISIVTVCFNAVKSIEETMLSVLNQTYPNIEYIIIDGGSTDGTVDLIKKYSNRLAYWVSEPDKGIYDAMNKGIDIATGDYINFLNAGDEFYSPLTIGSVCHKINMPAVYYGDVLMTDNLYECYFYGGRFNCYRLAVSNICHQAIFYPVECLKGCRYEIRYPLLADWDVNQKLWKQLPFHYLKLIVARYKIGGASSGNVRDVLFYERRLIKLIKTLGVNSAMYWFVRKQMTKIHVVFKRIRNYWLSRARQ